jgi:type IV pilus assembly protein PilW
MTKKAFLAMKYHQPDTRRLTEQVGFTLIELMIGMALGLIVVAAAFTILTTTSKALRANEQVVDTQQNLRMAMELLTRDIKLAGFGNPGVPVGNCSSAIVPNDQTPTGVDSGADSVQMLVPATRTTGSNRWTLKVPTATSGVTQITLEPGAVADMVSSGLVANQSYISIGGSATAQVTGLDASASTISVSIPPPLWFQQGDQVYLLQCIRYQVVSPPDPGNLCGGNAPCLTRGVAGVVTGPNAEGPIAEGIEDLQLAYACDGCVTAINSGIPDHVIDDQPPNSNSFDQADFLSNVPWTAAPLTPDKIKLVQVALVARQSKNDQGFGESNNSIVGSAAVTVTSDHTLPADANHRRRVVVKTVDTRNVGL